MEPIFATCAFGDRSWRVGLVDCPHYVEFEEIADRLHTQYSQSIEHTDVLVLRPPVDRAIADPGVLRGKVLPFLERAPRASLHLLYSFDFTHMLSENLNNGVNTEMFSQMGKNNFLSWLREHELREYVNRSSALFKASSNFVYRAPSQTYVNMFLRVGNVQMTRQAIDAFFFWMLPFLKGREAILTDTWSISSIAFNAARLLDRYDPKGENHCRVDMLSAYYDGSPELIPETRDALRRVVGVGGRVLALISVVGTGKSLARLRRTVVTEAVAPSQFAFLALYKLRSEIGVDALCDLSSGIGDDKFEMVQHDTIEERGSPTVIDIDRRTYFPLHIRDSPMKIRKWAANPAYSFCTEYKGKRIFALHRNSYDLNRQRLRHHGIDIDVERLLKITEFRDKLSQHLCEIAPLPKVIVVPPHRAGQRLLEIAHNVLQQRLGHRVQSITHPDLHPGATDTPKDTIASLGIEDSILILDDVTGTGQRLSQYQHNLRKLEFVGRIHYLVGVVRPESEESWKVRVRNLSTRIDRPAVPHTVTYCDKVILPNWTDEDCPWCMEEKALRYLFREDDRVRSSRSIVAQRLVALQKAAAGSGLVENAIWRISGDEPRLTRTSIFLDYVNASDADVIAAVAAALQQMRAGKDGERLEATYPHATVIDHNEYLGDSPTFNDAILRLAILRAAKRNELERWGEDLETERRTFVRNEFLREDADCHAIRLEFALAMLAGKLPKPTISASLWEKLNGLSYRDLLRFVVLGKDEMNIGRPAVLRSDGGHT